MNSGKKLTDALLWGQFGITFRGAICFFIGILIARWMSVADYGLYASFLASLDFLITWTAFGVSSVFQNYIPQYRESQNPNECSYLVRWVLLFKFGIHLTVASLVFIFGEWFLNFFEIPGLGQFIWLLAIALVVRGTMNGFNFAVVSKMDIKFFSAVEIIATLYQLAAVLILNWIGFGTLEIIVLIITVNAMQLIGFAWGSRELMTPAPIAIPMKPILRFGVVVWSTTLFQYLTHKPIYSMLILYYLKNPEEVAYFDIAYMLCFKGGFALMASVDMLQLPILSGAFTRGGLEKLKIYWQALFKCMVILTFPILIFLALNSREIIHFLFTDKYLPAADLLFYFSCFSAASVLFGQRVATGVLYPLKKEKLVFSIRGSIGFLNLLLGVTLIPRLGALGAVIGKGVAVFAGNAIEFFVVLFHLKTGGPWKFLSSMVLITFLASLPLFFISAQTAFSMFGMVFIYIILFAILLLWRAPFENEERKALKQIFPKFFSILERVSIRQI